MDASNNVLSTHVPYKLLHFTVQRGHKPTLCIRPGK